MKKRQDINLNKKRENLEFEMFVDNLLIYETLIRRTAI